jgi:pimeloyl-ACP methyl ester carboxylesterase
MKKLDQWGRSLERDFVVAHGVRTATFRVRHETPDILLIHGINGSHHGLIELAWQLHNRGRRPLLVELPGHGASDTPGWNDIDNLRQWFLELHKLISGKYGAAPDVVAHSFGCYAVMPTGSRTTMICPVATKKRWLQAVAPITSQLFRLPLLARAYDSEAFAHWRGVWLLHNRNRHNRQSIDFVARYESATTPQQRLFQARLALSIPPRQDKAVFRDAQPDLVIIGRFDRLPRERTVEQMQKVFPKTRIVAVNSGHLPNVECVEQLADLL